MAARPTNLVVSVGLSQMFCFQRPPSTISFPFPPPNPLGLMVDVRSSTSENECHNVTPDSFLKLGREFL